ncbi:MAG: polysaccharide biosynthesis PFTS motif protein, partial [Candidatus Zixiibacteriota bacterium]
MRGYRYLKQSNKLEKIAEIKEELTVTVLERCGESASKLIFGAGREVSELITRQYLLLRLADLNLNRALLCAIGKRNAFVDFPMPREWRHVLRRHGLEVRNIKASVFWIIYCAFMLIHGMAKIAWILFRGLRQTLARRSKSLGRYAYFSGLATGNLPRPCKDGRSHDIVTWYARWPGRVPDLDALCHGVVGAEPTVVDELRVVPISTAVPPIVGIGRSAAFLAWGVCAGGIAFFSLLRGRWWNALMLGEAASAAAVRLNKTELPARDYLFHNSSWIYRPLWTYEAEKKGSRISFYFYSTNAEKFKRFDRYPSLYYGWRAVNWPLYLVWDKYQADFVRRAAGEAANIAVVGPI